MACEQKPVIIKSSRELAAPEFSAVLDNTCRQLHKKHAEHSLERIGKMDAELASLEKTLDEYIAHTNTKTITEKK